MATKADFNAEEWSTVVEGPLLAGMRVVRAERGGTIRESVAIGRVYAEARQAQDPSGLIDELVSSPPALDSRQFADAGALEAAIDDRLHAALRLVREKGTAEDVAAYGEFVLGVARAAAEAHKEGGFIGIGGKPVSDAEQAVIDQIRTVVDESSGAGT